MKTNKIVLVEPFFGGSHKKWALGLQKHSRHSIEILSLPDKNWKWRMHGGAIEMANQLNQLNFDPDIILCSDMMDLALFKSLIISKARIFIYFHENQLTYPWFEQREDISRKSDLNYAFINYSSALVADQVFFNSIYHQTAFLDALTGFLEILPEPKNLYTVDLIRKKSSVLYVGINSGIKKTKVENSKPIVLWNHRFEYDKNPDLFFESLIKLKEDKIDFGLVVLGEQKKTVDTKMGSIKKELADHILHWGYIPNEQEYDELLNSCHIAPITSKQDFFGISLIESCLAGLYPIIPNRLAFPETIPFQKYFYQKDEDYYSKLKEVLENKLYLAPQTELIHHCEKYYWENLIESYDHEFDQ